MRKERFLFHVFPASLIFGAFIFGTGACSSSSSNVSFKADVLPIMRQSCGLSSSCHGEQAAAPPAQHFYGTATGAGDMTAAQIQAIFDQSVGKPSIDNPDMNVITAGDSKKSFLMYKLDGDPTAVSLTDAALTCAKDMSCMGGMPQGGPQLSQDDRDLIRNWIDQGAKNN
jgi:hypothetical protein